MLHSKEDAAGLRGFSGSPSERPGAGSAGEDQFTRCRLASVRLRTVRGPWTEERKIGPAEGGPPKTWVAPWDALWEPMP